MGLTSAWLPSRRSVEHQIGARVITVSGQVRSGEAAYVCFREAMRHYEKAEALRPARNDEAILRWNTCARMLNAHPELKPRAPDSSEHMLE